MENLESESIISREVGLAMQPAAGLRALDRNTLSRGSQQHVPAVVLESESELSQLSSSLRGCSCLWKSMAGEGPD